jgi:hypothetical protein
MIEMMSSSIFELAAQLKVSNPRLSSPEKVVSRDRV